MMLKSVALASDAKWRFIEEHTEVQPSEVKIALSLGPFGTTVSQDYDGVYPPPYGPKEYTAEEINTNTFRADELERVERSIQALASFHLERLNVFSDHALTWGMIDHLAFETVPLAREVKAIRRAISRLKEALAGQGREADMKPWWISCTFPSGRFPDGDAASPLSAQQVAAAAFESTPSTRADAVQDLIPTAFGINCTPLKSSRALVHEMGLEVAKLKDRSLPAPMLVIYPNNDAVYDPSSRSWRSGGGEMTGEVWATELSSLVKEVVQEGVWDGVLVGGCCKVGPDKIRALSCKLERKAS
jgi:homocysteine S-methyltransferase